jgi:sulfatase modifying factor 1
MIKRQQEFDVMSMVRPIHRARRSETRQRNPTMRRYESRPTTHHAKQTTGSARRLAACLGLALCAAAPALADVPPDYGFDFVTIGDTGNVAYEGGPFGQLAGRGSVNYEYRMATMEISAAQWLEFINIFSPQIGTPFWGQLNTTAPIQPAWPSTNQFVLTGSASEVGQYPVLGISWRQAAMYVNWLNNDKATDLWAIMDGAYDVSTFDYQEGIGFTDQAAHHPDARYWIPTLDEWLKAVYYDPDKDGTGEGGWWLYPDGSDSPLTIGPPGMGATNGGPFDGANNIPLGAYGVTTPWGLLDASGGAAEWTEELVLGDFGIAGRMLRGSHANDGETGWYLDQIDVPGWGGPLSGSNLGSGVRIASSIPTPSIMYVVIVMLPGILYRRQRS